MRTQAGKEWYVNLEFNEATIYDEECGHFVEGEMEVYKSRNNKTYEYDFGDGTCDNLADLTIDGSTTEITMKPVNL